MTNHDDTLAERYWEHKALSDMSQREWEALCDGCGKCCLHKLQDEDSGDIVFTSVSCRHLDLETCSCQVYSQRQRYVPDCLTLTPENVNEVDWLPASCAYRLLADGQPLPEWHPLVCSDPQAVHRAHISVCGKVISEDDIAEEDLDLYIIDNLS